MSEAVSAGTERRELTTEELGEIVRIVDPELDVQAILAEIRENIARRPPLDPDPRDLVYRPQEAAVLTAQTELEWLIDQASAAQRDLVIGERLAVPPGLVGALAARVKRPLHQLARFYVELLAQKVARLDDAVIRALSIIATRSNRVDDELAALRQEVRQLKAQLAELRGEAE